MALAFSAALRDETASFDKATESRRATKSIADNANLPGPSTQQVPPRTAQPIDTSPGGDPTLPPAPSPQTTASPATAATGSRRGVLIGILALLVIVGGIVGAVFILDGEDDNDGPPPVAAVPTPFPRAETFEGQNFTMTIPDEWLTPPVELPTLNQRIDAFHVWAAPGREAIVMFTLIDADLGGDARFFREAVDQYVASQYNRRVLGGMFEYIDETTAEDGTIRRSYRYNAEVQGDRVRLDALPGNLELGNGQFDVFFVQEAPYMGVLEIYTADAVGNRFNVRLQGMLDSLRIDGNPPPPPPRNDDDD